MSVKIACCYAREDEALLHHLKVYLMPLQQIGLIDTWHDYDINARTELESKVIGRLENAQIILLLISPEFLSSVYCSGMEMDRAIERHYQEEITVIPVILRPTAWEEALGALQVLPRNAEPVTGSYWNSLDKAFLDIKDGIVDAIEEIRARYTLADKYDTYFNRQTVIHRLLCRLVDERPELERDTCSETIVRFGIKSWDIPVLRSGKKWPPSGRVLLFTIEDKRETLDFQLGLGWPAAETEIRGMLFRMALANEPPFRPIHFQQLPTKWVYLYRHKMLHPQAYNNLSNDTLEAEIRKEWMHFVENVLPQLDAIVRKQEWFRSSTNS